ncbi:hypothetical protein PRVXT_000644 [Proteinivorax tanatarense]|uniref:HTH psq-type domain-containing protein n=1 Tax=Proteinivorax tanatarense TaxID=1260629 RepID=A0AAU7VP37_9FIRM
MSKIRTNGKHRPYSKDFNSVIEKIEQSNESISKIARDFDVPKSTIYTWINNSDKDLKVHNHKEKWTSEEKFHMVLEASALNETELAD